MILKTKKEKKIHNLNERNYMRNKTLNKPNEGECKDKKESKANVETRTKTK